MSAKKILLLANEYSTIVNFRMELLSTLIDKGYRVAVALPEHDRNKEIRELGCKTINLDIDRKGMNPLKEIYTVNKIIKVIDAYCPDIVLTFTIKPNIYGGIACTIKKIPYVANITGLGTALEKKGVMQLITSYLYKIGLKRAQKVFFQNSDNRDFMINRGIYKGDYEMIPGSGVNLERFCLLDYPVDKEIHFAYVARVMKEKGIEQYCNAARYIKKKYPNTVFHVCGAMESGYGEKIKNLEDKGIIIYHGMVKDMPSMYKKIHCTVLPTYYPEGMSNVLLESAASGIPIITTDRAGCREIVENNVNGFVIKPHDSKDLICKIEKFLKMSHDKRLEMGLAGRRKVENEFDRNIVINKYLEEIESLNR